MGVATLTEYLAWWHAACLDLGACQPVEIVTPLMAGEEADARMASWPEEIRRRSQDMARRWLDDHPERELVAVTTGLATDGSGKKCCVLMLSHRERGKDG